MLADLLNKVREQAVGEIEQRADIIEGRGLPSVGRTQRLNSLFDELIAALRYGGVDGQALPVPAVVDSALDSEERERVCPSCPADGGCHGGDPWRHRCVGVHGRRGRACTGDPQAGLRKHGIPPLGTRRER
jgi:hypothetical protein